MELNESILELWDEYNTLINKHTDEGIAGNEFIDDKLNDLIIEIVASCDCDSITYVLYQNIGLDLYYENYEDIDHYKDILTQYKKGEIKMEDIRYIDIRLYDEIIKTRKYIEESK